MPGTEKHLITVYNFHISSRYFSVWNQRTQKVETGFTKHTVGELQKVGPTENAPNTYYHIKVNDDQTEFGGPSRLNDAKSTHQGGNVVEADPGSNQTLAQDVITKKGVLIKAGESVFAGIAKSVTIYDANGNVIRGNHEIFEVAVPVTDERGQLGALSLGFSSSLPLEKGMQIQFKQYSGRTGTNSHGSFDEFLTHAEAPVYSKLNHAPCFVAGAKIVTSRGPVAIENLKTGDLIQTKDNDLQPLRWIGVSRIRKEVLAADPRRYPVRVRAGAIGENSPVRDCYFSRQHRILVTKPNRNEEILIPVKDLIGLPGIELADDWEGDVDYWHMVFDNHEIVLSDGAQTESLLLTEYSTSMLGEAEKLQLLALRPEMSKMKPARKILKGKEARELLGRIVKRGLHLQDVPEFL